jgi:hypothetical protein
MAASLLSTSTEFSAGSAGALIIIIFTCVTIFRHSGVSIFVYDCYYVVTNGKHNRFLWGEIIQWRHGYSGA